MNFQRSFRTLWIGLAGLAGVMAGGRLALPLVTTPRALAQEAAAGTSASTRDAPLLHSLFSDNAVLQRDRAIPVWGWTTPGRTVTVKLDERATTARADANGRWMARIGPYPAGGPHTLTATFANAGANNAAETLTRQNILFGDVWLCSGQSNMEMGLGNVINAEQEVAAANYPLIRLFTVPKATSATPLRDINSRWLLCTPRNIAAGGWNGFSAVAYFFGRKLHQELNVPIGLIHSSWGGTEAEAWVSASALGTLPDFTEQIAQVRQAAGQSVVPFEQQLSDWMVASDPGLKPDWAAPATGEIAASDAAASDTAAGDTGWKSLMVPGNWENAGVAAWQDFDGLALYRRAVEIPADWAGHDLTLRPGAIDDADITYWNGVVVGRGSGWDQQRAYTVPGAQVRAGRNVIAIRVTDNDGLGGITGPTDAIRVERDADHVVPLAGPWQFRASVPASKMATAPTWIGPDNPHVVTVLYNAMIAPLEPYALKGAIWYQGEANAGRPEQYGRLLPTLIHDWRRRFASPLPFHIVQLAGFMAPDTTPKSDDWPLLRAAQMRTAEIVERTGIAITTDIGEENDIHPRNKQDVGLRLALSALAQDYGRDVEYSGPVAQSIARKGDSITVTFTHAAGGLTLKGDADHVFAVAGVDGNWFWAKPIVQGNRITLKSPVVPQPVAVRFGWSNLPRAALYNGANLPAAPFQIGP